MKRLSAYVDFCGLSCKPISEVSGSDKLVFYRPKMKTTRDYWVQLHLGGKNGCSSCSHIMDTILTFWLLVLPVFLILHHIFELFWTSSFPAARLFGLCCCCCIFRCVESCCVVGVVVELSCWCCCSLLTAIPKQLSWWVLALSCYDVFSKHVGWLLQCKKCCGLGGRWSSIGLV